MKKNSLVFQFKITLDDINPVVWRRIQVPIKYSFWDFHVAIQDSMGWLDYHLHQFVFTGPYKKVSYIGIPDDEGYDDIKIHPGWGLKISDHFRTPGDEMKYEYDFGDGWSHQVLLEGILLAESNKKYPICIEGQRACPPEDCGSIPGYYELLKTLKKGKGPEFEENKEWLKGHAKCYWPYNPDEFSPEKVKFDDPKKRFRIAFKEK